MRPRTLRTRYAAGLALAFLLVAAEVIAIVVSLADQGVAGSQSLFSRANLFATVALVVVGTGMVVLGGVLTVAPLLRWLGSGREPTPNEHRTATNLATFQSMVLSAPWAVAAAVLIPMNVEGGRSVCLVIGFTSMFGATASISTGFLFTQRTLRPLLAAAATDPGTSRMAPGVRARLLLMWTVCTALPGLGIATLILLHRYGVMIEPSVSIEVPALVLAMMSVVLGFRATILVAQSISDPVRELVAAMARVEKGHIGDRVEVYERSEIGRLQTGFNNMVAGLEERDRLQVLFGRHVGAEVARRAVEAGDAAAGDVRNAAILFVDLVGSTGLTAGRSPRQVAELLNDFFRIVVAEVDERNGLVNKFQGDAALAVFGAPVRIDDPATAALATARALGVALRRLPVDFGIGVSAGPVFAGNIGAENRYEYTVIGDAVNEAARLADRAKSFRGRVLCSDAVVHCADDAERRHWDAHASEVLRGRSAPTAICAPVGR